MRIALVAVLAALTLSVAWFAGEQHRENCESAGKVSCSVLPWDSGEVERIKGDDRLTPFGCEVARAANEQALNESQVQPLPPECR